MTRPGVDRLVEEGMLERVQPDRAGPRRLLDQARRHLRSAQELMEADPSLAYAALYDAARKAVAAHMAAQGYRVPAQLGGHRTVVLYARAILEGRLPEAHLARFDRLRRNRNLSEYGAWEPSQTMINSDLEHAAAIVEAVEKLLD